MNLGITAVNNQTNYGKNMTFGITQLRMKDKGRALQNLPLILSPLEKLNSQIVIKEVERMPSRKKISRIVEEQADIIRVFVRKGEDCDFVTLCGTSPKLDNKISKMYNLGSLNNKIADMIGCIKHSTP